MNTIKQAEKLIQDAEKQLVKMEYGSVRMKGVSNLSAADLDEAITYAKQFIQNSGAGFEPFMRPLGPLKQLLDAYGVKPAVSDWRWHA